MRKSLLKAALAAAVLLCHLQSAAAQIGATKSREDAAFDVPALCTEPGLSKGTQRDNLEHTGTQAMKYVAEEKLRATLRSERTELAVFAAPEKTIDYLTLGETHVQSGEVNAELAVGNVTVQERNVVNCCVILVPAKTIVVDDEKRALSVGSERSVYSASTSSQNALPDSPGAVQTEENSRSKHSSKKGPPPTASSGKVFDAKEAGWSFWAANAVIFGSSVAAAEMTHRCLEAGACRFVPDTFQRRRNMYLVGMPVAAGVSYFGYYLKRSGHRWWFVPAALVTAGNFVVITHAARNH